MSKLINIVEKLIEPRFPAPTEEKIKVLSDLYNVDLSDRVREIYSFCDGGYLKSEMIHFKNKIEVVLSEILSVDTILLIMQTAFKDSFLSNSLLPLATDPFGNFICIKIYGEEKDSIYFQDHELDWKTNKIISPVKVANNLEEFLSDLMSGEEYERKHLNNKVS